MTSYCGKSLTFIFTPANALSGVALNLIFFVKYKDNG